MKLVVSPVHERSVAKTS